MFGVIFSALVATSMPAEASQGWKVLPIYGGGYIQNVVIAPSKTDVWYTYVDVGGIYRSNDAGRNWRPLHGNLEARFKNIRADYVRALSVDPRDENRFVFCGGDAPGMPPAGIFATSDGGKSFSLKAECAFSGNGAGRWLGQAIARNPRNADELLAGEYCVMKSRDNGETWSKTAFPEGHFICDLKYDLTRTGRVYACTAAVPARGMRAGFLRSDDGGETWRKLSDFSPTEIVQLPGESRIVGYFRGMEMRSSRDGGETWKSFHRGLPPFCEKPRYIAAGDFSALCGSLDFFLAGDGSGAIYKRGSHDDSWRIVRQNSRIPGSPVAEPRFQRGNVPPMWAMGSLVVDPQNRDHWMATDWYVIWETRNAGKDWTTRVNGIMPLVSFGLWFDPLSPANIIYGLADMGMFYSNDGGVTFKGQKDDRVYINDAAFSSKEEGLILAVGGRGGTSLCRSRDAGRTWEVLSAKGLPSLKGKNSTARAYSVAYRHADDTFALCVSGKSLPGEGGVYLSSDEGDGWIWCGEGLPTGKNAFKDSEWGGTELLTCSVDGTLLLRGVHVKKMWRLPLGTKRWEECSGVYGAVAADSFVPGRFLCCANGKLLESVDGAVTFSACPRSPSGIESASFDKALRGAVVVTDNSGFVHMSHDGGRTFKQIPGSDSLPIGRCHRAVVNNGRIFVFTAGSGVWTTR
jgi:photosystem II stability/assembly factor-like uncharacterized protein